MNGVQWYYHNPAYRRKRLDAYRCCNRALHRVAERIAGHRALPDPAQSNVVVGLGSWSVSGAHSAGPISFKAAAHRRRGCEAASGALRAARSKVNGLERWP